MKTYLIAMACLLSLNSWADSQLIKTTFYSQLLAQQSEIENPVRELFIYLPEGYQNSNRHYPVVYIIHGWGANAETWFAPDVALKESLDQQILNKKIQPMILVALDNHSAYTHSFGRNSSATGPWRDVNSKEITRYIDSQYRTIANRNNRAIAGGSAGGYAALNIGINNPETFAVVYALSPAYVSSARGEARAFKHNFRLTSVQVLSQDKKYWSQATMGYASIAAAFLPAPSQKLGFVNNFQLDKHSNLYLQKSIQAQVKDNPKALSNTNLAFDIGDQDFLYYGTDALTAELDKAGISHKYTVYPGDHTSGLAKTVKENLLPFVSNSFTYK